MKKTAISFLSIGTLCVLMFVSACKKEAGPTGPAGKDGINGNANVKVVMFLDDTLSSSMSIQHELPITSEQVDSTVILTYIRDGGFWYPSPGLGYSASYMTRSYISAPAKVFLNMAVYNPDGTSFSGSTIYLSKVKVVIAPASSFVVGKKEAVDFSNYKATMNYFGLPE